MNVFLEKYTRSTLYVSENWVRIYKYSMIPHESPRFPMNPHDSPEFPRIPLDSQEFPRIPEVKKIMLWAIRKARFFLQTRSIWVKNNMLGMGLSVYQGD